MPDFDVRLRTLHPKQAAIAASTAKRKVCKAGRRSGKTTVAADIAVNAFLSGKRILYGVPTMEQVERFWYECCRALADPIEAGVLYKNESRHVIGYPSIKAQLQTEDGLMDVGEARIRGKTCYNADTLRGDYADELILDEYQLMKKDAWNLVGAPMLLDNNGNATFIYTTVRGEVHAKELYERAGNDKTGRWARFVFTSMDNPHLSREALEEIAEDMTDLAYRMEILGEDIGDDPRALWNREIIEHVTEFPPLLRVVVGVDPPGSEEGAECGIVVVGVGQIFKEVHAYVLGDYSVRGSPETWASAVVAAYHLHSADRVVAEVNHGGDMVASVIRSVESGIPFKEVRASRGKAVRAEPVVARYEGKRNPRTVHHVGVHQVLEDQMCGWVPGESRFSPDRVDALVWAVTDLIIKQRKQAKAGWVV